MTLYKEKCTMRNNETVTTTSVLLTPVEVAERLGLKNAETLAVWRSSKRYDLSYVRVGRLIRYREADLEAFIQRRCNASTIDQHSSDASLEKQNGKS